MIAPIARRDLLRDQRVGRVGVRHAQQSLGKAHQRQPLGIGQAKFLKEGLDHT